MLFFKKNKDSISIKLEDKDIISLFEYIKKEIFQNKKTYNNVYLVYVEQLFLGTISSHYLAELDRREKTELFKKIEEISLKVDTYIRKILSEI